MLAVRGNRPFLGIVLDACKALLRCVVSASGEAERLAEFAAEQPLAELPVNGVALA